MAACAWLLERGWEVFRNVAPTGAVDLVSLTDGVFTLIDGKTARITGDGHLNAGEAHGMTSMGSR
jgi:hypothetical protein